MAYVPIPKDLTKVRQKLILNLTKRQVICFSGGALIGVPLFFLTKNALPGSMATFLMIFAMMPFFALGLYEKNGEPLEVVLRHIIESRYLRPRRRIYQTQNIYALLESHCSRQQTESSQEAKSGRLRLSFAARGAGTEIASARSRRSPISGCTRTASAGWT